MHRTQRESSDASDQRKNMFSKIGQHEFLMHAILGFAASELLRTDSSLLAAAMNHRVRAVKSIKKRLADASKATTSPEETNALIATCFALTFQSVSLDDGLAEYMTFIRGIVIVGMQMMFRGIKPVFSTLFEEKQDELLEPLMQSLPLIRKGWTDAALEAVNGLKPLCVEPVEIEYQEKLLDIVQKLYVNSWTGRFASLRDLCTSCAETNADHGMSNSVQGALAATHLVDDATPQRLPRAHRTQQSDHVTAARALDLTATDHDTDHAARV